MPPSRPLVLQTEHLDLAAAAWLADRVELVPVAEGDKNFAELLSRCQGLVIRTYTKVNQALLDQAPNLVVVGRAGVGLDNVDLPACKARNVAVFNTPDANTRAVVEYVMALLLDATRPRLFIDKPLDAPKWKALREELKAKRQLCELTLGILGLGKIGRQVARVATALNMKVIYHDLLDIPPADRHGATPVSREELFATSDAISIHIDERPSNRNTLTQADFARMKSDVIFINTSRGFVLSALDLAEFLLKHPASQALLDVHEPEPIVPTYPLLDITNAHLSPHIASATQLANRNMSLVVHSVHEELTRRGLARP
jgi:phosphoglycerate dehydrogenase-like enzyme